MSKYSVVGIWDQIFPGQNEVVDYAGRRMVRSAIGNQNSRFCSTIDHIRPIWDGGKDCIANKLYVIKVQMQKKRTHFLTGQQTVNGFRQSVSEELLTNTIFIN